MAQVIALIFLSVKVKAFILDFPPQSAGCADFKRILIVNLKIGQMHEPSLLAFLPRRIDGFDTFNSMDDATFIVYIFNPLDIFLNLLFPSDNPFPAAVVFH